MSKVSEKVIHEFLTHMEDKGYFMCKIDNWNNNSIWKKDNPQEQHRTMIRIKFDVERLNKTDKELEVSKFLENRKD
jgi:hypothetical protein